MFDSRPCSAQQHAVTLLQMSTTNPHFNISLSATFHPGLSPTEGHVSVSGCTDAGPSLLVARRELMVMSQLLPAPIPRHMTFCIGLRPPLWGHRWPITLQPFHNQTPKLNSNSYILMSRVHRHPPPDTLLDKETCMLPLIWHSFFLRVLYGWWASYRSLAQSVLRLREPPTLIKE